MWTTPENPVPIKNDELRVGVFVWIDRSWSDHPFLSNKFRILDDKVLAQVKALGPKDIYWIPSKSTVRPIAAVKHREPPETPPDANREHQENQLRIKNEQVEKQRALFVKAKTERSKALNSTHDALLKLRDHPRQAGASMRDFAGSVTTSISQGDSLLMLLNDQEGQGLQHHALNCMTLSTLIAKSLNLPPQVISEVALGALAHDVGETLIPKHILQSGTRNRAEENLYRDHCRLGVKLAETSGVFSEAALSAVRDHHELLDGSGFPEGKEDKKIGLIPRIIAVADIYERLCSPASPDQAPMLPSEALKMMWNDYQTRLDSKMITALIRLLGIYPPGTIVTLNDGSLGLVVSPGKSSLIPKVLIYDPDTKKDDAIIIELEEGGALRIEESVSPRDLPADALAWLSPGERTAYYFTAEQSK